MFQFTLDSYFTNIMFPFRKFQERTMLCVGAQPVWTRGSSFFFFFNVWLQRICDENVATVPPCWRRGLSFLVSSVGPPMCVGSLLRGVLNSRGVESWCLRLFPCDVPNCCFPVAWNVPFWCLGLVLHGVLECSFLVSWTARSWWLSSRAAALRPSKAIAIAVDWERPSRGRQKSSHIDAADRAAAPLRPQDASCNDAKERPPSVRTLWWSAPPPPTATSFPVAWTWLLSNFQRAASSLASEGGRSPTANGPTPPRNQEAAAAPPSERRLFRSSEEAAASPSLSLSCYSFFAKCLTCLQIVWLFEISCASVWKEVQRVRMEVQGLPRTTVECVMLLTTLKIMMVTLLSISICCSRSESRWDHYISGTPNRVIAKSIAHATAFQGGGATVLDKAQVSEPVAHARPRSQSLVLGRSTRLASQSS